MASETEQERRETLADIVAEIRAYGAQPPPRLMWLEIADRIEAAWKRERAEVEANALAVGGIVEAARHKPGNAAAMSEALETILDKVNGLDEECGVDPVEIRDIARAALAAPARNCDRFADAEAARQAWLADAENWDEFGSPKLELHEWLLAPAAERKGDGDGSK